MKLLKISAFIASIFSVIFSLSIVFNLKKFVSNEIFYFAAVFVILLVVFNEWVKVGELNKRCMEKKSSLTIIIITFIFSFAMSTTGIYLWVNKTQELDIEINNSLHQEKLNIEEKYNIQLDSIDNISKGEEYSDVMKQIEFWKNRRPANIEERQMIRENIVKLESEKNNLYENYLKYKNSLKMRLNNQKQVELDLLQTKTRGEIKNLNRNDFLSIIFFLMVAFTEFVIIFIQHRISTYFAKEQRGVMSMVKDFELRKLENIDINKVKYSKFINIENFDEIKLIYNTLIDIEVISREGLILIDASKKVRNYYSQINKF